MPASNSQKQAKRYAFQLVFALCLTSFIPLSLGLSCAGIFYTPLSQHLGVGTGTLSYFTSILWIASVITLSPLGSLLANQDAKLCVTGATLIAALDFVWLSFTNSTIHFYIGAFVMGICVTMLLFLAPSTLINRWFAKNAGFYIGVSMAFTGIGGVVFSSVGGILIQSIGWSATYLAFAVLCALVLPFTWFMVKTSPAACSLSPYGQDASTATSSTPASSEPQGITQAEALRSPALYLLMAMTALLNFGMYVYFVMPAYINALPIGIELPLLGATAGSVAMAGQTIAKLALGALGEKWPGPSNIASICLGLLGVGVLAFVPQAAPIYIAAFAFGAFYGVTNVMMPILTRKSFGLRNYPQIYSKVSMAASLAGVAAGFLWGTVREITGTYATVFAGVSATMVLCIIVVAAIAAQLKKRSF